MSEKNIIAKQIVIHLLANADKWLETDKEKLKNALTNLLFANKSFEKLIA